MKGVPATGVTHARDIHARPDPLASAAHADFKVLSLTCYLLIMTAAFSTYLDVMRFMAACLVVIYHSRNPLFTKEWIPFSSYGHEAVIVFFVLSGYVIAYVSDTKERAPIAYWASRLARIYSLAIPAILLTIILDTIGERLAPRFYEGATTHDYWYIRLVSSWLFTNEAWVSIMSFSNVPYWSLCYEMWYYVLFSLYVHLNGRRRTVLIAAVCIFVGPKILLLLPLWVIGVVIYRWKAPYLLPIWVGWAFFLLSVILFGLYSHFQLTEVLSRWLLQAMGDHWHKQLAFSKFFIGDYLLGAIMFINFIGARRIADRVSSSMLKGSGTIRRISDFTFSLYILHQPLLLFSASLINWPSQGYAFYLAIMATTCMSIIVIGTILEKQRFPLRKWIQARIASIERSPVWQRRILPLILKALPA
ncbi:Peptidoglycan/LPS O-acetylase OafA/YrhL, contains acyltransferase and SGNH-hydrolase domains [Nitrosospira sp. Nsp18]|nr:Peptidoglycan/LPS O-acetylase OafA/YrhL, contains acyltransferase and SGNH-hydrolase domains [Nitrosospira sp. Nsp18]